MKLLSGTEASKLIKNQIKQDVEKLKLNGIVPHLVIVLNNSTHASEVYVGNKCKSCNEVGIKASIVKVPENTSKQELLNTIKQLNDDNSVHGILVQLPLADSSSEDDIIATINPKKDVDCFHLNNTGYLWTAKKRHDYLKPCTPAGIIELIKINNLDIEGKNVVIVNRSNIVGKPLASLFLQENATITICHSKTKNLKEVCKNADILICAIGKTNFFTNEYIGKNAIVIDVGTNRDSNNKLCGDVDVKTLIDFEGYLSPVPGGVGPMTVTMVLKNLVNLLKNTK